MTCRGLPRGWAAVGRTAITRSVLESSTAAAIPAIAVGPTAARHAGLREPKLGGFPQICAGCAACGCFWLNDSEEVRLDKHAMDDGPVPVGGRTRRPADVGGASVGGLM